MTEELRTVEVDGVVIGQIQQQWQQVDPYTWEEQWIIVGEPINFNHFEDALEYVHERYRVSA